MTRINSLRHDFVNHIPDVLDDGVLYVSIPFTSATHRCCCGCGIEVVTPIDPTGWEMTFDGRSVSLWPSIGNWSLACRAHYWIERNQVRWARHFPKNELKAGRPRYRFENNLPLGDKERHPKSFIRRWLRRIATCWSWKSR